MSRPIYISIEQSIFLVYFFISHYEYVCYIPDECRRKVCLCHPISLFHFIWKQS